MQTPDSSPAATENAPSAPPSDGLAAYGFLVLAVVSLAVAAAWLAVRPEMLYGSGTSGVAWMYLVVVGFFFSATFAGFYAVGPRVFEKTLHPRALPVWHLGIQVLCTVLTFPLAVSAGEKFQVSQWILPYLAPAVLVVPMLFALLGGPARGAGPAFLRAAAFWLLVGFAAGFVLAANHDHPFLREGHWIFAGFQVLVAGVFLNVILGAVHTLYPDRGEGPMVTSWPVLSCVFVNLGLAFVFHAAALGPRELVAGCAAVLAAGLVFSCLSLWGAIRREAAPPPGLRLIFSTLLLAVGAVVIGVGGLWQPEALTTPVLTSYVVAATLGVIGLPAMALCDVLAPVVLGLRRGGERPAPHPLSGQIQAAGYVNALVGVCLMVPGIWIASERVVSLGAYFFFMGVVAFVGHFLLLGRSRVAATAPLVSTSR